MLVIVITVIVVAVLLVAAAIASGSGRRFRSTRWREERHVSDDGRHVVETTEFD